MSSTPSSVRIARSGLVLVLVLAAGARAQQLTLYEGFDYGATGTNADALSGQTGGFGWRGPWLGSGYAGLASWWPLDGNATDAGPFASDGVMTNGEWSFDTPNIVWSTHCLKLESRQRGRIDFSPHIGKYDGLMRGSITLWTRSTNQVALMCMVGATNRQTNRSVQLYLRTGNLHYDVNGDLPSNNLLQGGSSISDGQWHHVAVTVDETGFATMYVDGGFEASGHQGFFGHAFDLQGLWIGRVELASPSRHYDGEIDDVAIWGSVLTEAEVQMLASVPPPMNPVPTPPLGPNLQSESLPTSSSPSGAFRTFAFGPEGNRVGDATGFPAYRRIREEVDLNSNEVHYVSCLMRLVTQGPDPSYEVRMTDNLDTHVRFGWNSAGRWIAGFDSSSTGLTGLPNVQPNVTYFVVVKIEPLNTGNDTISMKVYAPGETVHADDSLLGGLGTGPNDWSVVHNSEALINQCNAIGLVPLGTGSTIDIDELRIGWSWQAVTSLGYGQGCLGAAMAKQNRAQIGSTDFQVRLNGASPNQGAFLAIGRSRTLWGTVPLPFDLTPIGAPGCAMLASFDSTVLTTTGGSGSAAITLPIPNAPTLVGQFFYTQWAAVDATGSNPLGLAFSNGMEVPFER